MRIPRFSVRTMTYLVLFAAFDLAWAPNVWRMHSVLGFRWHCIDLPALGMANVLAVAGYPLLARPRGRPFRVGFVVGGLLSVAAYVGLLHASPDLYRAVDGYLMVFQNKYVDWIPIDDSHLGEPGYVWRYIPLDALLMVAGTFPLAASALATGLLAWLAARLFKRPLKEASQSGDPPASTC